jgi:hypothetical protein
LRIFLSFLQALRSHDIPPYQHWEFYAKKGIEEAASHWLEGSGVDWAEGLTHHDESSLAEWRGRSWDATLKQVRQAQRNGEIDLFLSYLYPQQVDSSAVKEIQKLGIPCVNFFCDNVREFRTVPREFYCFDLHWVPELSALEMYTTAGLRCVNAPMPVWIDPQLRTNRHPETFGISFIGSRDALREKLIAQALELGAQIEVRGAGWNGESISENGSARNLATKFASQLDLIRKQGIQAPLWKLDYKRQPQIPDEVFADSVRRSPGDAEYVAITQQSLVTLGINRYPSFRHSFSRPGTYSRLRDIEAPMMGACYLTEWTNELENLYELGGEIETYRTAEEMVEKIRELESSPRKRQHLRSRGQKRALECHTIGQTLTKIQTSL